MNSLPEIVLTPFPANPVAAADFHGGDVAIGNFDGVHRGHQAMLERLVTRAKAESRPAVVMTFDPHPLALLKVDGPPPGLTTISDRVKLLHQHGVDIVVVLQTTRELLRLTAEEFFTDVILKRLAARRLVEGPNFYFGKNRGGNVTLLRQMCQQHGLQLDVIEPVTCDSQWVSSSVIRSLLLSGELNDAVELLGHSYRMRGQVAHGAARGRQLGFATANLEQIPTVIPGPGVYAASSDLQGQTFAVAVNIGPNPTFGEEALKIEAHLLDFTGELYDCELAVDLQRRIRDVRKFDSPDELRQQIARDIEAVRSIVTASSLE